jgi:uncharacterized coiled-coil DUF342 family protein
MAAIIDPVQQLYGKLQLLLKQHQQLQKEQQRMRSELTRLQAEREETTARLEQLVLQVDVLKSAAGQLSDGDKKAFEKKLDRYLKDIDHCITLLSD